MPDPGFVHLRVHSAYSLSEGAVRLPQLKQQCLDFAMPAVAITDTNNLFGALEFSETMRKAGIQPIVGICLNLAAYDGTGEGTANRQLPEVIVLLAKDQRGYDNLLKLASAAHLESDAGDDPHITWSQLEAHHEGLILLTGGLDGPLARRLAAGQIEKARHWASQAAALFGDRIYVEIQRHGLDVEQAIEPPLLDLAYDLDLPLVATNDVFFTTANMHEAHDALLCIAQGTTVNDAARRQVSPAHYFKSAEEMQALFHDLPDAVANSCVIAQRCAVCAPTRPPILPNYAAGNDDASGAESEPDAMRRLAAEGLEVRLNAIGQNGAVDPGPYRERLEFEANVIIDMGFAGYFLIVADFIQWAKRHDIPVGPGRGSGGGSVVAWALGITDLDPLPFNLLFERFLNPDRVSMPDFDIDFCQDQRDRVIRYVQDRYGHDQVAQIITFGKLQARAVLRDVGRVLAMPYGHVDRLCKMVPNNPANPVTLKQAIDGEPRLQAEAEGDENVARLFDIAGRLEGLYRHASTHAAGVVIGDRPLQELVPLYRDPRSDMPVTQFNMKWVEPAGLVKFDFLGLKTLTVLDRTVKLLAARGIDFDLGAMPLDDTKTYQMLQKGDAIGVFQFEGSGMRDLLREAEPNNIEDLIALVALYRPGPMENIPKYVACKHGREDPEFLHETIEPVVSDTYGVIIYQEQVMQIAQVFAGYSLGQADLLRRAMGKKIKAEMDAQRETFIEGAKARGVDADRAAYVFDLVDKFAGYGFNKAHSAGYALVAYQTAYLKANYPVEFLAASMSLDLGNTDKLNVFRQELTRMDLGLLGPDINRSDVEFSVERSGEGEGAVRYALAAIKNVGREAVRLLVKERQQNGEFTDIWDFAGRIDGRVMNKRMLENLIRAGAFDSMTRNRAMLFDAVDVILRHAASAQADRGSGQTNLFGGDFAMPSAAPALPQRLDWSASDRLGEEFSAIGFYLSAHPLDAYQSLLEREEVIRYGEVLGRAKAGGSFFRLGGTVLGRQERRSARGKAFAFVQLSDASGMYEVVVFSEDLAQSRDLLEVGRSLVVDVEVRLDGEQLRLTAKRLIDIDRLTDRPGGAVRVFINSPDPVAGLSTLLAPVAGDGHTRVTLVVDLVDLDAEVEINLPAAYQIDAHLRGAIKATPGVVDVHELG